MNGGECPTCSMAGVSVPQGANGLCDNCWDALMVVVMELSRMKVSWHNIEGGANNDR